MIRGESLFLFLLLALGAAFSGWIYFTASHSISAQEASRKDTPDAFAENIIVSTLNPNGQLTQRLWAEYSEHFPKRDTTRLQTMRMELQRNDGPPWQVKSAQALIMKGGEKVQLSGNVELHRAGGPANKRTEAYTDLIDFWPDRDYAETDKPVRFQQPGLEVTAVGMRAYLEKDEVELLSRVHAIQQPNARNRP